MFRCTGFLVRACPHSIEIQPGGSESHPEDKEEIVASSSGSNYCKRPCSDGKRFSEEPSHKLRRVLSSLKSEEDPSLSINFDMLVFWFFFRKILNVDICLDCIDPSLGRILKACQPLLLFLTAFSSKALLFWLDRLKALEDHSILMSDLFLTKYSWQQFQWQSFCFSP